MSRTYKDEPDIVRAKKAPLLDVVVYHTHYRSVYVNDPVVFAVKSGYFLDDLKAYYPNITMFGYRFVAKDGREFFERHAEENLTYWPSEIIPSDPVLFTKTEVQISGPHKERFFDINMSCEEAGCTPYIKHEHYRRESKRWYKLTTSRNRRVKARSILRNMEKEANSSEDVFAVDDIKDNFDDFISPLIW